MFIVSKRNFIFIFGENDVERVAKDFIGDVPARVAEHKLFKAAVASGWIVVPESHRDKAIYEAEDVAKIRAQKADIRTDAPKAEEDTNEAPKVARKGAGRPRKAKE